MPYKTHGLRHDVDALFAKLLGEDKWSMTPCAVIVDMGGPLPLIALVRSAENLLSFADHAQVICGWPGKQRQDVFEFTVGQFRSARAGPSHSTGGADMSCTEEKRTDKEPEPAAAQTEAEPESGCPEKAESEAIPQEPAEQPKSGGPGPTPPPMPTPD